MSPASRDSWNRMVEHVGIGKSLSDSAVVGRLIREFLQSSFRHDGPTLLRESRKLAEVFAGQAQAYRSAAGWNPDGLAASLHQAIPEATEHTDVPTEVIQQVLVLGAQIARHLLSQAKDQDQAASYLNLFQQDWTRLFLGIPMQRQWVEKPAGQEGLW